MDSSRLHVAQQRVDRLAVGHEVGRAHERLDPFAVLGLAVLEGPLHHVLEVDDADDVVGALADHRDSGEARAQSERDRLTDRLRALDEDDLGTRDHHLPDEGVAELEDGVDHLPLLVLDEVVGLGHVDELSELGLGGERTLAEAAAGGERVSDDDEERGERTEERGEELGRACGGQGDALGMLTAERSRRDAEGDVRHDDHDHDGQCNRPADRPVMLSAEPVDKDEGDERGRGHRREG